MISFWDFMRQACEQLPVKTPEELDEEFREILTDRPYSKTRHEGDEQQNCFERHVGYETHVIGWDLGDPAGDVCVEWPICQ